MHYVHCHMVREQVTVTVYSATKKQAECTVKTENSGAYTTCSCSYDSSTEISAVMRVLVLTFASEPHIALNRADLGFQLGLVQQIHNENWIFIFRFK